MGSCGMLVPNSEAKIMCVKTGASLGVGESKKQTSTSFITY